MHLAESTQAEEIVRCSALLIMSAIFIAIARPWSRAFGIAAFYALVFMLIGVFQFEVLRGR